MNAKRCVLAVSVLAVVAASAVPAGARPIQTAKSPYRSPGEVELTPEYTDTLWIFWADFENTSGCNAGWTSHDVSGTTAQTNHWHIDDIRITEPYLGAHTWWCGTDFACGRQARGYANNWTQILRRRLPLGEWSETGDEVVLEFDQRFAMERDYDLGYVEASADNGETWDLLWDLLITNVGFPSMGAGLPKDWNDPVYGHIILDVSPYAGADMDLRFRFESDATYSSQDTPDNTLHSVEDGAWQLDNFEMIVNDVQVWYDDVESGENGWIHEDRAASGQTGYGFFRGEYGYDFKASRVLYCDHRPVGTWMYGATYSPLVPWWMVDVENTWLMSPPIDVGGREKLVAEWDMWVDLPAGSNDYFDIWVASEDAWACAQEPGLFFDEEPGAWFGGPFWGTWKDDWSALAGKDWLGVCFKLWNEEPPEPPVTHGSGIFLNRFRIGTVMNRETVFEADIWHSFHDWYEGDLNEALVDTALIHVHDPEGVAALKLLAWSDAVPHVYYAYVCEPCTLSPGWWKVPPPVTQMVAGAEVRYCFEATDSINEITYWPNRGPLTEPAFEFSILPRSGALTSGILLVDKHGRRTPGENRDYGHSSQYYYEEALEILGFSWDTYDVEVPSGSTSQSDGPPLELMERYTTQIWFTNDLGAQTVTATDQANLIQWLADAPEEERNLLLSGNKISEELIFRGKEVAGFHDMWLGASYLGALAFHDTSAIDTVAGLIDTAAVWTFMDYAGEDPLNPDPYPGECILAGACPDPLEEFDVIDAQPALQGITPISYIGSSCSTLSPAGVAYTAPTGYQTVLLGFGIEYMMDGVCGGSANYDPEAHFLTGIGDRVNLLGNILGTSEGGGYFNVPPTGQATGIAGAGAENALLAARPNPFGPATAIAYSVREAGPVTIRVYNIAGRVVRTLLDAELPAGASGTVSWNGADDRGRSCASGVYFYRIDAPGFTSSRKMVLLR